VFLNFPGTLVTLRKENSGRSYSHKQKYVAYGTIWAVLKDAWLVLKQF